MNTKAQSFSRLNNLPTKLHQAILSYLMEDDCQVRTVRDIFKELNSVHPVTSQSVRTALKRMLQSNWISRRSGKVNASIEPIENPQAMYYTIKPDGIAALAFAQDYSGIPFIDL
jgi:predicted transcriptional regulator